MDVEKVAHNTRKKFESGNLDIELLNKLYQNYNPLKDVYGFIQMSLDIFPRLNCGLASVYLKHALKSGEVVNGKYGDHNHTFLLADNKIIDITSDQYGGPKVYFGPITAPWSMT